MTRNDRPKSMRIRFDDGNWHRLDAIQGAANLYDRNKTDGVGLACDDMTFSLTRNKEICGMNQPVPLTSRIRMH